MPHFKSLFGIDKDQVQKTCVLLPFVPSKSLELLGIKGLTNGKLFASSSSPHLTVIKTGIGAALVGDSVLYLEDTPCENIIFLGSCGLINPKAGLDIGSLVIPSTAYGWESFSDILNRRATESAPVSPNEKLLELFLKKAKTLIPTSTCASFASLFLEDQWLPAFKKVNADIIEVECFALLNASLKARKKAMALLFVADILGEKPFNKELSLTDKKSLAEGISQACKLIKNFAASI
ncbi:MAG: hypothetical protein HQL16_00040 [Candidatus Omnitrophica bacterium]|nr:hypothetical protein [Candidatus Omnitrophota bacterium]